MIIGHDTLYSLHRKFFFYMRCVLLRHIPTVYMVDAYHGANAQTSCQRAREVVEANKRALGKGSAYDDFVLPIISGREQLASCLHGQSDLRSFVGLFHEADEQLQFSKALYPSAPFVLRDYFGDPSQQQDHVSWVPIGWRGIPNIDNHHYLPGHNSDSSSAECPTLARRVVGKGEQRRAEDMVRASERFHAISYRGSFRRNRQQMWNAVKEAYGGAVGSSTSSKVYLFDSQNSADVDQYFPVLSNSQFVLCPCGNNFETHRFWEVMWTGGIPIIEVCGRDGTRWTEAPGIREMKHFVTVPEGSWSAGGIKAIVDRYTSDPRAMDELQAKHVEWFNEYTRSLTLEVPRLLSHTKDKWCGGY
jgi:hypothetical protein